MADGSGTVQIIMDSRCRPSYSDDGAESSGPTGLEKQHNATAITPTGAAIGTIAEEAEDGEEEEFDDDSDLPSLLKLMTLARSQTPLLALTCAMYFGFIVGSLAQARIIALAIDTATNGDRITWVMLAFILTNFVTFGLAVLKSFVASVAAERCGASMCLRLFDAVLHQDLSLFHTVGSGGLLALFNVDVRFVQISVTHHATVVWFAFVKAPMVFAFMVYTSWHLAILFVVLMTLLSLLLMRYLLLVTSKAAARQESAARTFTAASECFNAIKVIRSCASEAIEIARYSQLVGNYGAKSYLCCLCPRDDGSLFYSTVVQRTTKAYGNAFLSWSTAIGVFAIAFAGLALVAEEKLSFGSVVQFMFLIMEFIGAVASVVVALDSLFEARARAVRIFGLLEMAEKDADITYSATLSKGQQTGFQPDYLGGDICFMNVSFFYPCRPEAYILENVSFSLERNRMTAFVGASGSGKSTVLSLIERFYDASSGMVTIDATDICDYNLVWLRQRIALVSQAPVVFAMTVRENVLYGITAASVANRKMSVAADVERACQEANIHDFILSLPQGYDTHVTAGQFSGGQKQRITIARAVLRNPRLLLLDEATSALDAESEHQCQEAFHRASIGRTVIAVAHRLKTIKKAAKIIVMSNRTVLDSGTHEELMERCEQYRESVLKQAGADEEDVQEGFPSSSQLALVGPGKDESPPGPAIKPSPMPQLLLDTPREDDLAKALCDKQALPSEPCSIIVESATWQESVPPKQDCTALRFDLLCECTPGMSTTASL